MDRRPDPPDDLALHGDFLRRLAYGLVRGDRHLAEDALQDTYLTALRHPPASGSVRAWLARVLASRVADQRRGTWRRREEPWAPELEVARVEERRELTDEVLDAVRSLSEEQRTAVYMRYFDGLPPREIAARLGCPVKTVKSRLHRALETLRTRVSQRTGTTRKEWGAVLLPNTGWATLGIGGLIMIKKLGLAAAILLAVLGAWKLFGPLDLDGTDAPAEMALTGSDSMDETRVVDLVPIESVGPELRVVPEVDESTNRTPLTGSLIVHTIWADRTPAPGIGIILESSRDPRVDFNSRRLRSDEMGTARIDGLPPGAFWIYSDHGGYKPAEVVAGEECEVRLLLTGSLLVEGVVVDADGRQVAGADVWVVHRRSDWLGAAVATSTGADGSFTLREMRASRSLGASATGLAPSELVDLDLTQRADGRAEVVLTLGPAGGSLRGRVFSATGAPVVGARVVAGACPERNGGNREDGTVQESWAPRSTLTDATGTYELGGLARGVQPLVVHSARHPEWRGEVEVGETTTLDVQLEVGVRVVGTVRDEHGAPVDNAMVILLDAPFVDPFPSQGPTERGQPFPRPGARSDAAGHFELTSLSPGEVHLYASKGTSSWYEEEQFRGATQISLTVAEGETARWDPVLSLGLVIQGRVTYLDGTPVNFSFVHARNRITSVASTEHTDEDGRFLIAGLEQAAHTVSVQLDDAPLGARPLRQEEVWPGRGELVFVADFLAPVPEEEAEVVISVVDDGERIAGVAAVLMGTDGAWHSTHILDGRHTTSLQPGRYMPLVFSGEDLVGVADEFEVAAGEVLDLGTFVTQPAGTLRVNVTQGPHAPDTRVTVEARQLAARPGLGTARMWLAEGEGTVRFENTGPGEMEVQVTGSGVASERQVVSVVSGVDAVVDITTRGARRQTLEFMIRERGWASFTMNLYDEADDLYYEISWREGGGSDPPYGVMPWFPVGRFRVEARTHNGLTVSGEVVIQSLDEADTPVLFEMR